MQMDGRALAFSSQPELVAYAARVMRGIVIDHIRQRRSAKHGGDLQFVPLDSLAEIRAMPVAESLLLDEAINTLAMKDAALAQLVELKFFGGLSLVDIAALRGVSERTVSLRAACSAAASCRSAWSL